MTLWRDQCLENSSKSTIGRSENTSIIGAKERKECGEIIYYVESGKRVREEEEEEEGKELISSSSDIGQKLDEK